MQYISEATNRAKRGFQRTKAAARWALGLPARRALRKGQPVRVDGVRLYLNPQDRYALDLTRWRRGGDPLLCRVREIIARNPRCVFLDVGANYGRYAISGTLVQCEDGHVIAVEPSPSTLPYLHRNIDLNDVSNRVTVAEVALGAAEGESHIFTNGFSGGDSLAEATTVIPGIYSATDLGVIPVVRGDALLDELNVPSEPMLAIKIDVQGFEVQVLQGLENRWTTQGQLICFCEFTPSLIRRAGMEPLDIWRALPNDVRISVSGYAEVLNFSSFRKLVQHLESTEGYVDLKIRR